MPAIFSSQPSAASCEVPLTQAGFKFAPESSKHSSRFPSKHSQRILIADSELLCAVYSDSAFARKKSLLWV
jgi:hypothetical protein